MTQDSKHFAKTKITVCSLLKGQETKPIAN